MSAPTPTTSELTMPEKNEALAEPRRCAWGFHKWSVWGMPQRYTVKVTVLGKHTSEPFLEDYQTRTCLRCGRKEERVAR